MSTLIWLTENYYPNRGGMAQSCDRITTHLRQAGISIHLIHFTNRRPSFQTETQENGTYTAIPLVEDPAHILQLCWQFLQQQNWQQQANTQLVAFGGFLPILAAPIFQKWLSIPLYTCIRGNDFDQAIFSPRKRPMLREAFEASTKILAVSKDKVQQINQWLQNKKAVYTPNGIENTWHPLQSHLQFAQNWKKKNRQDTRKVIGIFGHIKAKKGIDFFINTILQSQTLINNIHLLLIGAITANTQQLIEESTIKYHKLPFQDRYELLKYYPICDLIAIPSFYDGMPNVLLEAGSIGIPIIASRIDGMKDVLSTGNYGFLFPPNHQDACLEALHQFIKTPPKQLLEMGKNLQKHIQQNFNSQKETKNYLQILTPDP